MNSMTAAEGAGITYRQLDYWVHKGYIRETTKGSGNYRDLSGHEVRVLNLMASLVANGFRPETAAELARKMADGEPVVRLGPFCLIETKGAA